MNAESIEASRTVAIIVPHHPDRVRRPPPRVGAVAEDRFVQALQWNVFRTLELLPPAFWLRRLHARLTGDALQPAPQLVRVELWPVLPAPPRVAIDGATPAMVADVLIETEHAVWALQCEAAGAHGQESWHSALPDLVQATLWRAGTRRSHVGLIRMTPGSQAGIATAPDPLSRSSHSLALRMRAPLPEGTPPPSVGRLTWHELALVLEDCAESSILSAIERALASTALEWLIQAGIDPAEPHARHMARL